MRNGVLIEEASPEELLVKQNTNSLEEAFLSLSSNQQFNEVRMQRTIVSIIFLFY